MMQCKTVAHSLSDIAQLSNCGISWGGGTLWQFVAFYFLYKEKHEIGGSIINFAM